MVEKWQFLKLKSSVFFFQNWKTQLSKNIGIYVIAFDPIEIQTQQAPQNDCRNLSFVTIEWPKMVLKWPTQKVVSLISEQTLCRVQKHDRQGCPISGLVRLGCLIYWHESKGLLRLFQINRINPRWTLLTTFKSITLYV